MAQIPQYLEKLIIEGKAEYKTLSMALMNQMVILVPDQTYIVVYGYSYLPYAPMFGVNQGVDILGLNDDFYKYAIQYVNFINNGNFYPFQHTLEYDLFEVGNDFRYFRKGGHQHQDCYIVAKSDLSIYFTAMNDGNIGFQLDTLNVNGPIFNNLGYALGPQAVTAVSGYNVPSLLPPLEQYYPLQNKYTIPDYATAPQNFNQAYTNPNFGGELNFLDYLITGVIADKIKANHIVIHYVQVNQEPPKNLL